MKKFIAAVVASAFTLAAVSTFAADAAKKDELTVEQRAELRERVAKLKEQRAKGQQKTEAKTEKR